MNVNIRKYENYIYVFLISFIPQLIIILTSPSLTLWDENAYLANAKYVLGLSHYHELFRFPLLWWFLIPFVFLFNNNIILYRILLSIIFSISTIFLFKLFYKYNQNYFESYFFTILLSLNGLILFWGNKIYPDVFGLSFLIISIYFYYKYFNEDNKKNIILYSLFADLSFLAKYPYGLWYISFLFLNNNKDRLKALLYFILFLSPYFLYNIILYHNPIHNFISQFYAVYNNQYNQPISLFLYNVLSFLGILIFSILYIPKNNFEKGIYLFLLLSLIYFGFFVPMKHPRYLIQILLPSIIIFRFNINRIKMIKLLIYVLLGISLFYSIYSSINEYILPYDLCYSNLSSIYLTIQYLKQNNATVVLSNAFWIWYGNYLDAYSYSLYSENVTYLVDKLHPQYIVYSPNYGIIENYTGLNDYQLVQSYTDICGIQAYIYKV